MWPVASDARRTLSASTEVEPLEDVERKAILHALRAFEHNKTHAARALGISLKTLHNKLKRYAKEEVA